jgi:hypothetical protein
MRHAKIVESICQLCINGEASTDRVALRRGQIQGAENGDLHPPRYSAKPLIQRVDLDLFLKINMAELISLLASIVGIADVCVRSSQGIVEFISQFQDAPAKLETIQCRIEELQGTFDQIKTLGCSYDTLENDRPVRPLREVKQCLYSCQVKLSQIQQLLNDTHGFSGSVITSLKRKVKFLLKDRQCSDILRSIEESKTSLTMAMQTVTLYDKTRIELK